VDSQYQQQASASSPGPVVRKPHHVAQQLEVGKATVPATRRPPRGPLAPRHGSALRWPMSKDVWRPEVGTGRGSDPAMTAPGPAGAAFRRVGTLMPSQAWWYGGIGVNRDLKACLGALHLVIERGLQAWRARYTGRRQGS
jgi:hypothetical protein